MNRRKLLKGAAAVGAAAGLGALGRYALIAPPRSERLDSVDELAVRIFEALPPTVRSQACVALRSPFAAMPQPRARDGRRQRQRSLVRLGHALRAHRSLARRALRGRARAAAESRRDSLGRREPHAAARLRRSAHGPVSNRAVRSAPQSAARRREPRRRRVRRAAGLRRSARQRGRRLAGQCVSLPDGGGASADRRVDAGGARRRARRRRRRRK